MTLPRIHMAGNGPLDAVRTLHRIIEFSTRSNRVDVLIQKVNTSNAMCRSYLIYLLPIFSPHGRSWTEVCMDTRPRLWIMQWSEWNPCPDSKRLRLPKNRPPTRALSLIHGAICSVHEICFTIVDHSANAYTDIDLMSGENKGVTDGGT